MFDEHKEIYLFFTDLRPNSITSYYGCRYQAVNLVDLLSDSSNNNDSIRSCNNYTINLDTKHISSY